METEAKTKVSASVWGAEFLAASVILPRSIWKNGMNSTVLGNYKCIAFIFGNTVDRYTVQKVCTRFVKC